MKVLHQPVMLAEVLEGLSVEGNGFYIDGTFGRGGHSTAILERLSTRGKLCVIDQDPEAIAHANQRFGQDERVLIKHENFQHLGRIICDLQWEGQVAGILLDLGVSSPQLDDPKRGFSFLRNGPLDMRMDTTKGMDATTWLNAAPVEEIATVLREYGEERFAKRIARAIVKARSKMPINTTHALAEIIAKANPSRERNKHPATRAFQAIRIFINRELEVLKEVLDQALAALKVGGRLAVISFHSLEDRMVKQWMYQQSQGEPALAGLPLPEELLGKRVKRIAKYKASQEEIARNPRARSAILRIAEKIK